MKATKANEQSQGDSTAITSEQGTINFSNAYLLKGNTLQPQAAQQAHPPQERKFRSAKELTELVMGSSKLLFGQNTFLVTMPKKGTFTFGNNFVPTGFLLDLTDMVKPKFYILDIMLSTESLYSYVLPRITRFLSCLKSQETIEGLCELIGKDKDVIKALQVNIAPDDVQEYLKIAVIANHYILLITDGKMKDMQEVQEIYSQAWEMVKPVLIKKYASNGNILCIAEPPFSEIHRKESVVKVRAPRVPLTEEDHLRDAADEIKEAYSKVKTELLKADNQLQFNPQKYYISLRKNKNLAFFHFSRKRISLVVMNDEKDTRKQIKHHEVKALTETVQKFWNGRSCTIIIENAEHLNEVTALLKKLIIA